ncbi:hypothetical protein [Hungatella hathewayi]|uniref:hypothetical protein n=1 Tax=Hungatella hathewayi TaxID=154046 RepID=UPI00356B50CE
MKNNRIPKANKINDTNTGIKRQQLNHTQSGISFSFEALEITEYFDLDGTCINWSSELFEMLKKISSIKKEELLSGAYAKSTYRVHSHENASPPSSLPNGVELKDCYQIRISKSKGGIHGVFFDHVFYIIWLDPLHNMYPNENYGGLRKVKPGSTCCKDREEIIEKLQQDNKKLREEIEYWESEIEKLS